MPGIQLAAELFDHALGVSREDVLQHADLAFTETCSQAGHRTASPSEPSPGASRKKEDGNTGRGRRSG